MTIINKITVIVIICVAISANSKTNERKQRDLHVLPVRVHAINRDGKPQMQTSLSNLRMRLKVFFKFLDLLFADKHSETFNFKSTAKWRSK